jgi:hypothetical protein
MGNINPQLLKGAEKLGNWDEHVLTCDAIKGMTDEEKERARQSFQYLRRVLGEGFLRRGVIKGHPIVWPVINTTRWTRLWLIRLAESLDELSGADGFARVFRRFKVPKDAAEAESVLSAAFRFKRAGFTITFEPQVTVTQQDGQRRQKHPDLRLVNEEIGEEVIVEVSILERSAAHREAFDVSGFAITLLNALRPANLTVYAEMREGFDESYANEAMRLLTEIADEVAQTGEFRALVNEHIAAGIAPDNNTEQLCQWAEGHGISPGFTGPPLYSDEISRARMKIRDKLAQLPEDRPGVIVIPATASMMFNFYDPLLIVEVLNEEVGRYPRLWGVVLLHNFMGGEQREPKVMKLGTSTLISKTTADALQEQTAILLNEACELTLSNSTSEKLLAAFV